MSKGSILVLDELFQCIIIMLLNVLNFESELL